MLSLHLEELYIVNSGGRSLENTLLSEMDEYTEENQERGGSGQQFTKVAKSSHKTKHSFKDKILQ